MRKICPHCGSSAVSSFPAIYEQQNYRTYSQGLGTSYYPEGSGLHIVSSTSYTSSSLARKVAPPRKKEGGWIILLILAMFFIGVPLNIKVNDIIGKLLFLPESIVHNLTVITGTILLFMFIPATGIWCGLNVLRYNRKIYPRLYSNWLDMWYCYQCGLTHYSPD